MSWQPEKGDNVDRCPTCGEPTRLKFEAFWYKQTCPNGCAAAVKYYPVEMLKNPRPIIAKDQA